MSKANADFGADDIEVFPLRSPAGLMTKRHIQGNSHSGFSFCGRLIQQDMPILAFFANSNICRSCVRSAEVFVRDYIRPIWIVGPARRILSPGEFLVDDELKWLVSADYLDRTSDPKDHAVAEAIRCYWQIKSSDETLFRKLMLHKRIKELKHEYYKNEIKVG